MHEWVSEAGNTFPQFFRYFAYHKPHISHNFRRLVLPLCLEKTPYFAFAFALHCLMNYYTFVFSSKYQLLDTVNFLNIWWARLQHSTHDDRPATHRGIDLRTTVSHARSFCDVKRIAGFVILANLREKFQLATTTPSNKRTSNDDADDDDDRIHHQLRANYARIAESEKKAYTNK